MQDPCAWHPLVGNLVSGTSVGERGPLSEALIAKIHEDMPEDAILTVRFIHEAQGSHSLVSCPRRQAQKPGLLARLNPRCLCIDSADHTGLREESLKEASAT